MYIHEDKDWPSFTFDSNQLLPLLSRVKLKQGLILGKLSMAGYESRSSVYLNSLSLDAVKTSEIEGIKLNDEATRSSIARKLGMEFDSNVPSSRYIDGMVDMLYDASMNAWAPLTEERLEGWHAGLFPLGFSGIYKIKVGSYRESSMEVVSGAIGNTQVHFEAPPAERISKEMDTFLAWINDDEDDMDLVLKAAIAHLWFLTIHPFEDGNGRIARAISDMLLSRSEGSSIRPYSMSNQIQKECKDYYRILEATQKGSLDITLWLEWFLGCLERALEGAEIILDTIFRKTVFFQDHREEKLNERQRKIILMLFDGFKGNLTSGKWAKICKCSSDTALNDIRDLVAKGILKKGQAGGRSTSYSLEDIHL